MSVKIRLTVRGKKNQLAYRIVATDSRTKRDGKFLEILGFYNPKSGGEEKLLIEKEKITAWVKKGAQVSPSVALLLEKGTLERPKKPKVPSVVEEPKVKKEETQAVQAQTTPQTETPQEVAANDKLDQEPEAKAEEPEEEK